MSIRELKDHLSDLVREVADGERLVITRSGRPVAALVPISALAATATDQIVADLAARGVVRPPTAVRPAGAFQGEAAPERGKSAASMVLEDRR